MIEIFRALVGSQNYGLDTPESDKDYYIYCSPSFEELYNNTGLIKEVKYDNGIYFYKDIRSLSGLIKKASFNQLEIMYSVETYPEFYNMEFYVAQLFHWLQTRRNEIAVANLPRLYQSTLGEINRRISDIEKDKYTAGTKYLFNKHGYDTKIAMHAIRLAHLLKYIIDKQRLSDVLFCSDVEKKTLLDIKNGLLTKGSILWFLNKGRSQVESFSKWFQSQPVNTELLKELEQSIFKVVEELACEDSDI